MYGTEDRLCPPAGSVMLGERIGATDKRVKPYDGLYHEIFNEPEHDAVLSDLSALARHAALTRAAEICTWACRRARDPRGDRRAPVDHHLVGRSADQRQDQRRAVDFMIVGDRDHRCPDREELDHVRAPAVAALDDLDADDPLVA